MYSIVEIKGHQYRVSPGDLIDVELMEAEVGKSIDFTQVLLVGGEKTQVGFPTVAGAKVTAKVIRHGRDRKIIVLKRAPGGYRKKNGHRQHFTGLLVTEIQDGQGHTTKMPSDHKNQKLLKTK
jgi:large subunit ribosomal protein L21